MWASSPWDISSPSVSPSVSLSAIAGLVPIVIS
jgi:hypothetical protein